MPTKKKTGVIQLILFAVLGLSCLYNLIGIDWGLPFSWYPDEAETIEHIVIPMARNLDPNPHIFHKPSFYYYFLEGCLAPYFLGRELAGIKIESYRQFVGTVTLLSRIATALVGVLGVYLMFLLGKNIKDEKVGLIAAFLLATNLAYISYSHYAYMDVPMLVLLFLSLLLFFKYLDHLNTPLLYWASLIGGLSVSTKQNALMFIVLTLFVSHIARTFEQIKTERTVFKFCKTFFRWELFISAGLVILGFFIGTPFAVFDYPTFSIYLEKQMLALKGYKVFAESLSFLPNILFLKVGFGLPLFILSVAAFFWSITRLRLKFNIKIAILLMLPLCYYVYIGTWRISAIRYIIPMFPFLILGISLFVTWIFDRKKLFKILFSSVIVGIVLFSVFYSTKGVLNYTNDTRKEVYNWMISNMDDSSHVEVYSYSSYLPIFPEKVKLHSIIPNFIPEVKNYKSSIKGIDADEDIRNNIFGVIPASRSNISDFTFDALLKRQPDYIVLSSFYYTRYFGNENQNEETEAPELKSYFEGLINSEAGYRIVKKFDKEESVMQNFYLNPVILVLKRQEM